MTVTVAPVSPERWDDLRDLFQRPGPRGGSPMTANCFCQWWRDRTGDAAENQAHTRDLVQRGEAPGLLAYDDEGLVVGWVSIAPRTQYAKLLASRTLGRGDDSDGVWSLTCFALDRRSAPRGTVTALLTAAIGHARAQGAITVEAYPNQRSDYMGRRELFEAHGFEPHRDVGKRTIMRLTL